jgi:membrane protease YdiL (CAAX protease family)
MNLTPPQNNEKIQTWGFVDFLIILLGTGLFFAISIFIFSMVSAPEDSNLAAAMEPTAAQSVGLAAIEAIALLSGVYIFGLRRLHYTWKDLGFITINNKWLLLTITISFIVIPISGLITVLVMMALGLPLENPQLEFIIPQDITWLGGLGLLLFGGIAVPIAEEVFFRGVLYRWVRERWGIFIGVMVSSLIFGLIHIDIAVASTAFILGIILALVYEYSKSLWTAILIHAINNSIKIILIYLLFIFDIPM